jgi:hypothetical protein
MPANEAANPRKNQRHAAGGAGETGRHGHDDVGCQQQSQQEPRHLPMRFGMCNQTFSPRIDCTAEQTEGDDDGDENSGQQ